MDKFIEKYDIKEIMNEETFQQKCNEWEREANLHDPLTVTIIDRESFRPFCVDDGASEEKEEIAVNIDGWHGVFINKQCQAMFPTETRARLWIDECSIYPKSQFKTLQITHKEAQKFDINTFRLFDYNIDGLTAMVSFYEMFVRRVNNNKTVADNLYEFVHSITHNSSAYESIKSLADKLCPRAGNATGDLPIETYLKDLHEFADGLEMKRTRKEK